MVSRFSRYPLSAPLCPAPSCSLRQSPHCYVRPWVMHMCPLATLFPVLTSHPLDYSVTTDLYFLIPAFFSPISLTPFPSGNHQNVISMILFLFYVFILFSVCLFVGVFFGFSCWYICICCHFVVHVFDLLKADPLASHLMLVWWWCTLLTFSYLGSSLSVFWF